MGVATTTAEILLRAKMDIANVKQSVGEIQAAFDKVQMPKNLGNKFIGDMTRINQEIANYERILAKGDTTPKGLGELAKSGHDILSLFNKLQVTAAQVGNLSNKELAKLFPPEIANNIKAAQTAMDNFTLAEKKTANEITGLNNKLDSQKAKLRELQKEQVALKNTPIISDSQYKILESQLKEAEAAFRRFNQAKLESGQTRGQRYTELTEYTKNFAAEKGGDAAARKDPTYRNAIKEMQEYETQANKLVGAINQAKAALKGVQSQDSFNQALQGNKNSIRDTVAEIEKLKQSIASLESTGSAGNIAKLFQELSKIPNLDISKYTQDAEGAKKALADLTNNGISLTKQQLMSLQNALKTSSPAFSSLRQNTEQAAYQQQVLNDKMRETDMLRSRIQYFFGLSNAINLFKRALRQAFNTVKELDKAMTETAVVTKFDISDMWDQLPKYTKTANSLGTTTLGAYQTMTLYYQQGLKTNEVFEIGTETMKMARIAGLEYEDATNKMTAALRGFNMELNEQSAQRVNDVYSKLAAITASNVDEISTAMTKTASIADSANMSFETTSALLSQIIETTREAPETAGTAMKTIIARFQELKKAPEEIGEVDGEIVDANKIEGALRTIGVALRDTSGQFRNLDDVFLEIAKKWDGLDTNTQRYIATMAAGSRQQSRFIAMMQDYDRTMELVAAANDSAGASQNQFEKTQDSLESKINKLKNAWNEFLLGITNSSVIKQGVDILTQLITAINKFTTSTKAGSAGIATSFKRILVSILALKSAKVIFNGLWGAMKPGVGLISSFGTNLSAEFGGVIRSFGLFSRGISQAGQAAINNFSSFSTMAGASLTKFNSSLSQSNSHMLLYRKAISNLGVSFGTELQTLGLSANQVGAYNLAIARGIPAQQAYGLLIDENAASNYLNANSERDKNAALLEGQKTQSLSNATLVQSIGIKVASALANTKWAWTEKLLTKAIQSRTAATLIGLGTIAAAVGAVVLVFALLKKAREAAYNNSAEGKLEKATQEAEAAAKAADEAKEAYTNLSEAFDSLETKEETLENLTEGTQAWYEALNEVNQQVLDLIELIPELAQYLEYDSNGRLVINYEQGKNADYYLGQQQQEVYRTNALSFAANYEKESRAMDVLWDNVDQFSKFNAYTMDERQLMNERYFDDLQDGVYNWSSEMENTVKQHLWDNLSAEDRPSNWTDLDLSEQIQLGNYDLIKAGIDIATQQYSNSTAFDELNSSLANFIDNSIIPQGSMEDSEYLEKITPQLINWFKTQWGYDPSVSSPINDAITNYLNNLTVESINTMRNIGEQDNTEAQYSAMLTVQYQSALQTLQQQGENISNIDNLDQDVYGQAYQTAYNDVLKEGITDKNRTDYYQKFAENRGYTYDAATGKMYEGEGESKVDITKQITDDMVLTFNAQNQAYTELIGTTQQLITSLNGKTELRNLLSNEGEEISYEFLMEHQGQDVSTILQDLKTQYGYDSLTAMAEDFGMTIGQLTEIVGNNLEIAQKKLVSQRVRVGNAAERRLRENRHLISNTKFSEDFDITSYAAGFVDNIEKTYGQAFFDAFDRVANIEGITDVNLQAGLENYLLGLSTMTIDSPNGENYGVSIEEIEKAASFVEGINWSNPISAVNELNKALISGDPILANYAKGLLEIESYSLNAEAQFRFLYQSESFTGIQEEISEIINEQGKLSGSDIDDLADSYSDLDKFIENTGVSIEGMAKALSLIDKGTLSVQNLTDSVLQSLTKFDTLNSIITETLRSLEEFDLGQDENQVNDSINNWYEVLNENFERGTVANSQVFNIMDYIFGVNWDKDLSPEQIYKQIQSTTNRLGQLAESGNLYGLWYNFAKNGQDLLGNDITNSEAYQQLINEHSLSVLADGQINLESNGKTARELTDLIAEAFGSENLAEMMVTDIAQTSLTMRPELEQAEFEAAMAEVAENASTVTTLESRISYEDTNKASGTNMRIRRGEAQVIDEQEIQSIAAIWGKERDEIVSYLEQNNPNLVITNLFDEEGALKDGQAILDNLNQIAVQEGVEGGDAYSTSFVEAVGNRYDADLDGTYETIRVGYQDLINELIAYGIPSDQVESVAQEVMTAINNGLQNGEKLEVEYTLENGETSVEPFVPEVDMSVANQQAQENFEAEALTNIISEAIQQGLSDIDPAVDPAQLATNVTEPINEAILAVNSDLSPTVMSSALTDITSSIQTAINNVDTNLTVSMSPGNNLTMSTGNDTITVTLRAFKKGIKNSPGSWDALVGEEGPELVQTKNGAYLAGVNGPEVTHINKGDTVYTAKETENIFSQKKKDTMPRYFVGYGGNSNHGGHGSGSSSGNSNNNSSNSDDSDVWENGFDKLYNLVRQIDEELRQRERIERRYEKLLESFDVNAKDLVKLSREEIKQIQYEIELQKKLAEGRKKQIQDYLKENSDLQQYATVETNEYGEQVIRIDWDAINAVTDQDLGERIDDYVGQLEDWVDEINDTEETIRDMEDTIDEINQRGKDEYFDFEESVRDALEEAYQKEIDELSAINDSINDTNSRLLDAMQSTIDQQRQERDNAKTEEELESKQRRLEYLRQDTSGANDLEIMQLEKEIDEGYEDYTDQLIDQKISELQKQNDEAAEQREKQISLAQAQLDHAIVSGAIWQQAYDLMDAGIDDDGTIIPNSDLMEVLKQSASFQGMSELSKMDWLDELNQNVALAIGYLKLGRQLENLGIKKGTKITFTTADGKKLTGEADDKGNVTVNGKKYTDIYQNYDGSYVTDENYKEPDPPPAPPTNTGSNNGNATNQNIAVGGYVKVNKGARFSNGQAIIESVRSSGVISGKPGAFKVLKKYNDNLYYIGRDWSTSGVTGLMDKKYLTAYKTGGLADFTGPAWLDGTKARPELILNQRDTENFIQLKNVLASLMGGNTKSSENSGDSTYDIDINVESIGSDYDVEQLAEKVKTMINDTARYRNNNTISRKR